jgi:uncharacterized protein (DUF1015 family)
MGILMANVQPFRGLRYDLSKVGSLADAVAPPYDVISSDLQSKLYDGNDYNIVRLILNRGDDLMGDQTIYDRASKIMKDWKRDGVLTQDAVATIYVYHQTFEFEGTTYNRRGFVARCKLEPFGEGTIYPHEQTHAKAKEDRFKLMSACKANLSQIFSIYPDPDNAAQAILEDAIDDRTPLTVVDPDGVKHEMWMVTDTNAIAQVSAILGPKPAYIADGHHRYETSCNIQQAMRKELSIEGDHPCDYTLMMFISMHDPGLAVLPTHRLFRGVPELTSTDFTAKISSCFDVTAVGKGTKLTQETWETIAVEGEQGTLGFYCRGDDTWVLARLNESGMTKMAEIAADQSDRWQGLGVSLLHKLVIEELLGLSDLPSPLYVHGIDEVIDGIEKGDAAGRDATGQQGSGEHFQLACLVMPASVEDVKVISEEGLRMPAKSTYFYPKLLSGLMINPLDT